MATLRRQRCLVAILLRPTASGHEAHGPRDEVPRAAGADACLATACLPRQTHGVDRGAVRNDTAPAQLVLGPRMAPHDLPGRGPALGRGCALPEDVRHGVFRGPRRQGALVVDRNATTAVAAEVGLIPRRVNPPGGHVLVVHGHVIHRPLCGQQPQSQVARRRSATWCRGSHWCFACDGVDLRPTDPLSIPSVILKGAIRAELAVAAGHANLRPVDAEAHPAPLPKCCPLARVGRLCGPLGGAPPGGVAACSAFEA
mmetsp:Transcript_78277/g.198997  ORF Transcript_78277/g.198997 Transcript_78277/m.198997 type:complete len:256 (+) Transcript_78277:228-995(+)